MVIYCPRCDGCGEYECDECDGEGCESCPGRCGRFPCPDCAGTGCVDECDTEDPRWELYLSELNRLHHHEDPNTEERRRAQQEHEDRVSFSLGDLPLPVAIAALHNAAYAFAAGFLHPNNEYVATPADAARWLSRADGNPEYFLDYINGRFMKIRIFSESRIDVRRYDSAYGAGTAERMIAVARASGPTAPEILEHHNRVSARNRLLVELPEQDGE